MVGHHWIVWLSLFSNDPRTTDKNDFHLPFLVHLSLSIMYILDPVVQLFRNERKRNNTVLSLWGIEGQCYIVTHRIWYLLKPIQYYLQDSYVHIKYRFDWENISSHHPSHF